MDSIRMEEWKTPAIAVVAAVFGSLITLLGQHWASSRERDTRMVELSLRMLQVKPEEEQLKAVRPWVIRVLEHHSGTTFYPNERDALLKGALPEVPLTRPLREYPEPGGEFRSRSYR
jgi:hypothetical protein